MAKARGLHGLTKETHKHLVLDAGILIANYGTPAERKLGATTGSPTFTVEREVRDMGEEINGAKGKTKGLRRVVTENAQMSFDLKEMALANLQMALSGSSTTSVTEGDSQYDEIRPGDITEEDYYENLALATTLSGSSDPIIVMIYNALSDENFEFGSEDKSEGATTVTMSAHHDLEDDDATLWAIRYPRLDSTETQAQGASVQTLKATTDKASTDKA